MAKRIKKMSELVKDVQKRIHNDDKVAANLLKTSKGKAFADVKEEELEKAGEALKEFLQDELRNYLRDEWIPTGSFGWVGNHYRSTVGTLIGSIEVKLVKGNTNKAVVYFSDSGSYRESFLTNPGQYELGYMPSLINEGWTVKKEVGFKDVWHVGHYDGFEFIEAAVERAEKDPRFSNIHIETNKNNPI